MAPLGVSLLAPAKVNLTLHVTGRRADGRHLLDSIVVFAATGDEVDLRLAAATTLSVRGPFAGAVPPGEDNLALRAARLAGASVAIALGKELPVGAGIGGGSSDAAAVLRGIAVLAGTPPPEPLQLGADVPVCLAARPARMRGIGERLDRLPSLPELPLVLVNPGVEVATGAVFAALEEPGGTPMPAEVPRWPDQVAAAAWVAAQRNDLEAVAIRIAPAIAEARAALGAATGCLLARMSGSGSTVFGLFASAVDADRAAAGIARQRPGWWVRATRALASPPAVQEMRPTT